MIVELFGLPGSGKTTLAKSFVEEGAILIPPSGQVRMVGESLLYGLLHPLRASRLFFFILTHSPRSARTLLLENLFFATNAKYMRARRISREGGVAVIDQGYFQTLLSLFGSAPEDAVLLKLIRILPKPDLLLALATPLEERLRRVKERGRPLRKSAGEEVFPRALALLESERISHKLLPGVAGTKLVPLLTQHISYITHARMPTEKAHGISIAHMCASFANLGAQVLLLVPRRKNHIVQDLFSFYGVPKNFSIHGVDSKDFLGRGLTAPLFFFLQRMLFLFALKPSSVPPGIVYTREPEIAWKFSKTHLSVFEAHSWPRGLSGRVQAWLVRNTELVVCNSRGTADTAKYYGVEHTIVAPNGFDPALFANTARKTRSELGLLEGVLALYAGSDKPGKGAEIAREAGAVVVTGKAPAEVPAYLMSADILVLPNTREGESERYTSPIKLFEYLGAGKAIIASDLPSIREILKDGDALFVPPGDAQALAKAIKTLSGDTSLRTQLASRAKALSASYTWDARAERILKVLG